ncbi:hypothetical protein DYB25_007102 [Aphanomyces astaci]|uniref:Uncharacterized protein n=1 Tax=Aphanomyces astaci TaxID=112090 RepID=A0A397AGS9_APHAT|nr:hypothetical protein DYB25_007102 [Aphanomyces astaci]RHY11446.1 hypothetical protein DYB36_005154 [Aphanomyces astaci]
MKPPIKSQSDMTGTIAESPRSFALSTMPTMALRKLHAMRDLAKLPFTVEPSCNTRLHYAAACNKLNAVISILQDRMQNDVDVRNKVRLSVKHQREQISKATV